MRPSQELVSQIQAQDEQVHKEDRERGRAHDPQVVLVLDEQEPFPRTHRVAGRKVPDAQACRELLDLQKMDHRDAALREDVQDATVRVVARGEPEGEARGNEPRVLGAPETGESTPYVPVEPDRLASRRRDRVVECYPLADLLD